MINLYEEIVEELELHNKTIEDIEWIGTTKYIIDKTKFIEDSKKLKYDNGYGLSVINKDLIIAGNNWYLVRWEYDGSEGFTYISLLTKPKKKIVYTRKFTIPKTYLRDFYWK